MISTDQLAGPSLPISEEIHSEKHRQPGESFAESTTRIADALKDDHDHFLAFRDILRNMRFLPGGRVQSAVGATRRVTPYNCFVSPTISDSMTGIMDVAAKAAETMRLGGGIGYDFSPIRPYKDRIKSLDSSASGPVSFMGIFDAICKTISSAGHRRGAQMGVLRVDHPDIMEFIRAKHNSDNLTNFNISVGITDEFMEAVKAGSSFDLRFGGKVYDTVQARDLWDHIMRSNWDWAEPGVLFIDRINEMNNLWYCENIAATNPCGEQPLPPNGACLLGSFNLARYIYREHSGQHRLALSTLHKDVRHVVRAMDNVVDRAIYPLPEQEAEAKAKRRMGLGVTGVANALEAIGHPYGTPGFCQALDTILRGFTDVIYFESACLAYEKGSFPLFDAEQFMKGKFVKRLPIETQRLISTYGLRNSHLTSIAPTGSISLTADNVSSGLEPVFAVSSDRTINTPTGPRVETITDYGKRVFGVTPRTANEVTAEEHVKVLTIASKWMDSAVSKTCNVGDDVTWEQFKGIYMSAYEGGAKGCTTFRMAGKRMGILTETKEPVETGGAACVYDPTTGIRSCE
jgi:ribonucleoside-diphosphate reductase alpha chain